MELPTTKEQILNNAILIKQPPLVNGIYFLILNGVIVYIGSSNNCTHRLKTHRRDRKIMYNHYYIVEHDVLKGNDLKALEIEYIKHHKPRYNRQHNPDYTNKKKVLWFAFLQHFNTYVEVSKLTRVQLSTTQNIITGVRTIKDAVYQKVFDAVVTNGYKNATNN